MYTMCYIFLFLFIFLVNHLIYLGFNRWQYEKVLECFQDEIFSRFSFYKKINVCQIFHLAAKTMLHSCNLLRKSSFFKQVCGFEFEYQ
ncbi:MAG: hypothetical protein EXX96DRAFT_248274 [Benjaminiella poitrasii]|nr:MAG: hypothetical protein EXX96DRAFT_248274 [Benjaminiella poitrasii]